MRPVLTLLFVLLCAFMQKASAQTVCSIRYSYDGDGNRTKREYVCETPPGPNDPVGPIANTPILRSVYPNPTTGVFHAGFSTAVSSAFFSIIAIDGTLIEERQIAQPVDIVSFDISTCAPGAYILTVIAGNAMENYTITRLQGR